MSESDFQKELASVINRHSRENGSNTPDFILATYLSACLDAFNDASKAREKWYGVENKPGQSSH
jgi:hypothetical protein